jgi:ferredoxin
MLTSEKIKQYAKKCGADIVGIGSMDRFEGAPKEMDPRYIFPEAKAIIGFGFRILRGSLRGIEEGTYFAAYPSMGYAHINLVYAPNVLRQVACMIEDEGYEAVPIQNMVIGSSVEILRGKPTNISVPVSSDRPAPDVLLHFRIAAVICGMGETGYSKLFLSPEFGPRQRLAFLLTDAPLEPDPIYEGPSICDKCMLCVQECPGKAISKEKVVRIKIAGREFVWGELNEERCMLAYTGGNKEFNPFLPPNFIEIDFEKIDGKGAGYARPEFQALQSIPYNASSLYTFHHLGAIEGARGCIRACMMHLEEEGRIKNIFNEKFRKREAWRLNR